MRLELQNYSAAVAFEILRIYLQESYESRPLVQRKTVGDVFGAFLGRMLIFVGFACLLVILLLFFWGGRGQALCSDTRERLIKFIMLMGGGVIFD